MNSLIESFEKFADYLSYRFTGWRLFKFIFVWIICLLICGSVILLPGYLNRTRRIPFMNGQIAEEDGLSNGDTGITDNDDTNDTQISNETPQPDQPSQTNQDTPTNPESVLGQSTSADINNVATMGDLNGILTSLNYLIASTDSIYNLYGYGLYSSNIVKWETLHKEAQDLIAAIETYKDNMDPDISKLYSRALAAAKDYEAVTNEGLKLAQDGSKDVSLLNKDIDNFNESFDNFRLLVIEDYHDQYENAGLTFNDHNQPYSVGLKEAVEPADL